MRESEVAVTAPVQYSVGAPKRGTWWAILAVLLALLGACRPASAQEAICATVKIEIRQELILERQAFEAHMRINNGLDDATLDHVGIDVAFTDENGNPVVASSDPNNTGAQFFIRVDSLDGIADIAGNGTIAPSTSADIRWLIIPAPGAGGQLASGKLYYVGATLRYQFKGQEKTTVVSPDYVFVKPIPLLSLDYFLTRDVYADDAFTPQIEPIEPFTLGVRVKNNGQGIARNIRIDSAQPRIVENKQGLLINFRIVGSTVNDQPSTPSLLVNLGDAPPNQSTVGRWIMETTLSGRFVDFAADFTHADELGGELTSLLQSVQTHSLVRDVLVDLPGRDGVRDFLALDDDILRVYESSGVDTVVTDQSAFATLTAGSNGAHTLAAPPTAGFLYVRLSDPYYGSKEVTEAIRSDGKPLSPHNVWFSKTRNRDNRWEYHLNIFDANSTGRFNLNLNNVVSGPKAPVMQYIPDRSTTVGRQLAFLVEASDPNGTLPVLSAAPLPPGTRFTDETASALLSTSVFDWTPVAGQEGAYNITFKASDGILETSQTVKITVAGGSGGGERFPDVPSTYWAYEAIEALAASGVTTGCGSGKFCPEDVVTRAQLALFLERKLRGGDYAPAAASGNRFADVPADYWAAAWIERLANDGIAGGCGDGRYCPNDAVTRAELAIPLGRIIHGAAYTPPAAQGNRFGDVTATTFAAAWIERLANDGIAGGCGEGRYCPRGIVTRAELAVLLHRITSITPLAATASATTTNAAMASADRERPPGGAVNANSAVLLDSKVDAGASSSPAAAARRLSTTDLPPELRALLEEKGARIADVFADAAGEWIVFASDSADLVAGDTNGATDVFLYEVLVQKLRRISVSSAGAEGNGPSYSPRMDGFGKSIAFVSDADNLVENDPNEVADLFLHQPAFGRTERLSAGLRGEPANGPSYSPRIDGSGELIVFVSDASNLVANDHNGVADVFLYDLVRKTTERVSHDERGIPTTTAAAHPALDGPGEQILYDRSSEDGLRRIYGHERGFALAEMVSDSHDERGRSLDNHHPALSDDGRYLTYVEEVRDGVERENTCWIVVRERRIARVARLACPEPAAALPDPTPFFGEEGRVLQWFHEPLPVSPTMDGFPTTPATTITLPNPLWDANSR